MNKYRIKIKAVLMNDNRYLIVKKWYDDRIHEPYQWECLDGNLMFGEAPESAAERIVREQTQLEVSNGRLYYTWSYVVGDICYVGICYIFDAGNTEIFLSEELQEYSWVNKDELQKYLMNDNVRNDILNAEMK